jgi:hypothetical protein
MINKLLDFINNKRAARQEKRIRNKWLGLYMESIGKVNYFDNGFGEGRINKEKYARPVWNRGVKPLTSYEVMKKTVSE